jgi:hypothetical protein
LTNIAVGRDVDLARLEAMNLGVPLPPVYPGSTVGKCRTCDVAVWVGPRAQAAIEALADVVVLCFPCAVQTQPDALVNLGNPYVRKEPQS